MIVGHLWAVLASGSPWNWRTSKAYGPGKNVPSKGAERPRLFDKEHTQASHGMQSEKKTSLVFQSTYLPSVAWHTSRWVSGLIPHSNFRHEQFTTGGYDEGTAIHYTMV